MVGSVSQEKRLFPKASAKAAHEQMQPNLEALPERELAIQRLGNQVAHVFAGKHG
jgi:hypothetical protein